MATHQIKNERAEIVNLKDVGESFHGWITGTHQGKFGPMYDAINVQFKPVSIQPNEDLKVKLSQVPLGMLVLIELTSREKTTNGNEFKKFNVQWDDDPQTTLQSALMNKSKMETENL
jgi:hypothetical protein